MGSGAFAGVESVEGASVAEEVAAVAAALVAAQVWSVAGEIAVPIGSGQLDPPRR
jgi:hypothetical protein